MTVKRIILLSFLSFVSLINYAQDKSFFVEEAGDTVKCEITRISTAYLFYSIDGVRSRIELENVKFHSGLSQTEKVVIPKDSVSFFTKIPENKESNEEVFERLAGISNNQRMRVAINLGGGYRVAQASGDIPKSYTDQLRLGFQYSTKFQYFGRKDVGFGLEYHQFFNKTKDNLPQVGDISDNIKISYLGVSSVRRKQESDQGNRSYLEIGLGAVFYQDKAEVNHQPLLIEGTTFGINVQYGYDIVISESMSIGLDVGFLLASLYSIEVNGTTVTAQNQDDGESLSRINLGLGFRFSK